MLSLLRVWSLSHAAIFVVAVGLLYIVVSGITSYHRLSQFRGPPLAAVSSIWLFWKVVSKQQRDAQVAAHSTYGPVVRIAPNLLLTNDPDIIRHMNAPASKWRRSGWYDAMRLDPRTDSVFSTRGEKRHAELRQLEIGGYQGKGIDTLEPDINARVVDLMDLVRAKHNGAVMDMSKIARYFTLDVLSTVAFGAPFGFMKANDDLWGPALDFARSAVAERYGDNVKQRKDMLGYFVEKGLSQTQCEVEAFLQIIAGFDSTTAVIRCTMYLLVSNPTAYSKLRSETNLTISQDTVSNPVITYAEAQRLPYLSACIWERLRMNPPVFGLKSKIAPPGGEQIKDNYFPEGTELGSCDYASTRSKETFGEDADLYRPDRWIEASHDQKVKFRYTVDTIFGSGRYQCLGRHIAFIELHKVFFELLRNFDWSIADPVQGVESYATSVLIQQNMNMVAWPRV